MRVLPCLCAFHVDVGFLWSSDDAWVGEKGAIRMLTSPSMTLSCLHERVTMASSRCRGHISALRKRHSDSHVH